MDLKANPTGVLLGAVMAVVAITMAAGWRARWGAALLIVAGPLGIVEFGIWPVLQRIDLLGLAVYVLATGPGRWSADLEAGRAVEPALDDHARAIWALRLAAGVSLIVVAFAEKLATPALAVHFLSDHPELNLAQQLGIGMTGVEYTRLAGGIEVLFGLLLISGALPQACTVLVGIPFNATLWFFGANELMGHLPTYGAMLALLVYGSDPQLRPTVSLLRPPFAAPPHRSRPAASGQRGVGGQGPRRAEPRGRPQVPDVCASLRQSLAPTHTISQEPARHQPLTFLLRRSPGSGR
jgi:uncharacterized membrane protein YphA (DoxX/SURF4 family)